MSGRNSPWLFSRSEMPVYLKVVIPIENIFEDLKTLPPAKAQERQAALARPFGSLSPEEADELERVIEEGCEQINEHGW
jgi:hypothetical protein